MQFLLEGQEEIGSPNLAELLQENAKLLKADIALSADGGQISPKHVSHTTTALVFTSAAHDLSRGKPCFGIQNSDTIKQVLLQPWYRQAWTVICWLCYSLELLWVFAVG